MVGSNHLRSLKEDVVTSGNTPGTVIGIIILVLLVSGFVLFGLAYVIAFVLSERRWRNNAPHIKKRPWFARNSEGCEIDLKADFIYDDDDGNPEDDQSVAEGTEVGRSNSVYSVSDVAQVNYDTQDEADPYAGDPLARAIRESLIHRMNRRDTVESLDEVSTSPATFADVAPGSAAVQRSVEITQSLSTTRPCSETSLEGPSKLNQTLPRVASSSISTCENTSDQINNTEASPDFSVNENGTCVEENQHRIDTAEATEVVVSTHSNRHGDVAAFGGSDASKHNGMETSMDNKVGARYNGNEADDSMHNSGKTNDAKHNGGKKTDSKHNSMETTDSKHNSVETLDSKHNSVETLHSKHNDVETLHSKHNDVETLHSKHNDVETLHSKHNDVETLHSKDNGVETLNSKHNGVETLHSKHNDVETLHSKHNGNEDDTRNNIAKSESIETTEKLLPQHPSRPPIASLTGRMVEMSDDDSYYSDTDDSASDVMNDENCLESLNQLDTSSEEKEGGKISNELHFDEENSISGNSSAEFQHGSVNAAAPEVDGGSLTSVLSSSSIDFEMYRSNSGDDFKPTTIPSLTNVGISSNERCAPTDTGSKSSRQGATLTLVTNGTSNRPELNCSPSGCSPSGSTGSRSSSTTYIVNGDEQSDEQRQLHQAVEPTFEKIPYGETTTVSLS